MMFNDVGVHRFLETLVEHNKYSFTLLTSFMMLQVQLNTSLILLKHRRGSQEHRHVDRRSTFLAEIPQRVYPRQIRRAQDARVKNRPGHAQNTVLFLRTCS